MRKCPNCKKAVPVGARRCVYCRTILGESENEDYGNSTQLGFLRDRDSGSFSQNNVMQRRNGAGGYQDGGVHQTMIGLGPIPAGTGRGSDNDRGSNQGFAQRTMAGMPGISFDAQHPNGTYRMGAQSSAGASGSGWRVEPNYQSQNNAMPVDPIQIQARTPERPMKPVAQRDPVIEKKAEPVIPPPQAKAGTENVLAGLPGVAPMPSSLVDEEFVDLTSKLFGAEFAEVNQVDEEEEDGFDFDAPAAHPAPVAAAAVPPTPASPAAPAAPPATPLSGYPTLKPPADSKASDKSSEDQKASDKSSEEQETSAPQKDAAAEAAPSGQAAASHKAKLSTMMFAALASAGLSALMAILWFVMASGSINWDAQMTIALVGAAAANIVIDAVCLIAYRKFSSMTLAILFFVGVVLFMGAAVMASGNILALPLFALAMVAQLAAAIR